MENILKDYYQLILRDRDYIEKYRLNKENVSNKEIFYKILNTLEHSFLF